MKGAWRTVLFELLTTGSMLGVAGYSYYKKGTATTNDADKIIKIAENCGLAKKGEGLRLYRRNYNKKGKYTEYAFKIPLGLSLEDFKGNYDRFKDGLNNKSVKKLEFAKLKDLKFNKDIVKQLRSFFNNRVQFNKELEMEYDGMLLIRVYDHGLQDYYPLTLEIMAGGKAWQVPLGVTLQGTVIHDFEEGPHILIGGATDMGKSNVLNVIITTLLNNHAKEVEFTLIDLKGGLEFGCYEHLPQVKNFAVNPTEALTALQNVKNQMEEIFEVLRKSGKKKVQDLGYKKRHFVIIDESAELASAGEVDKDEKAIKVECENLIKDIARRGRASGIRLLYCTQYPTAETVSSQVKRNLITRICLPVDTAIASMVVLDEGGAEKLNGKGRAIYKKLRTQQMQAYVISEDIIDTIVGPKITLRGRKDNAPQETTTTATARTYTADFEEVGLPND